MGSQPLDGKRELASSNFVKKPTSYEMILKDTQEQVDAPRSIVRESRSTKKSYVTHVSSLMMNFIYIVIDDELFSFQEATYQQVWQDAMVQDIVS